MTQKETPDIKYGFKDSLTLQSVPALGDTGPGVGKVRRMEGKRRVDSLEADVERLRRELERIDQEILNLAGKNGHHREGNGGSKGQNKDPR